MVTRAVTAVILIVIGVKTLINMQSSHALDPGKAVFLVLFLGAVYGVVHLLIGVRETPTGGGDW